MNPAPGQTGQVRPERQGRRSDGCRMESLFLWQFATDSFKPPESPDERLALDDRDGPFATAIE